MGSRCSLRLPNSSLTADIAQYTLVSRTRNVVKDKGYVPLSGPLADRKDISYLLRLMHEPSIRPRAYRLSLLIESIQWGIRRLYRLQIPQRRYHITECKSQGAHMLKNTFIQAERQAQSKFTNMQNTTRPSSQSRQHDSVLKTHLNRQSIAPHSPSSIMHSSQSAMQSSHQQGKDATSPCSRSTDCTASSPFIS